MADLGGRDRGQIILIAAFALAVIFVTLALVVNSAIFTENLASRGDTTGSSEALAERAAVEENVGNAIEAANRNNASGDLDGAVQTSIGQYQSQSGDQQASSGQLTDVSYVSSETGRNITYDGGGTFNGPGSAYDLADGVDRVTDGDGTRAFVIDATSLPDGSASQPPFNISVIDNNDARWTAEIYEDTGSGEVVIQTVRYDDTDSLVATEECRISAESSNAIDITEGTVNGQPCPALGTTDDSAGDNLNFGAGTNDPYRIRFEDTDNIAGSYSLVVHGVSSTDITTAGNDFDALYQVTVQYSYTTTDLQYTTDIRVAPGEPDA